MNRPTMKKIVKPGFVRIGRFNRAVFCSIEFVDGRLSICGVEGPLPSGNAHGSCGQIVDSLRGPDFTPMKGFPVAEFRKVWQRWHLNDMRAGSPAQEQWLRDNPAPGYDTASAALSAAGLNPDPATGYKYGSAWNVESVPAEVLAWLEALPDTDVTPAWV